MGIKVTVNFDPDEVMQIYQRELNRATTKIAYEFIKSISQVLNRGKSPPPSRPGRPPHKLTGALGNSFSATGVRGNMAGKDAYDAKATVKQLNVGSVLKYAMALQWGSAARNLKARPYLQPAMRTITKGNVRKKGTHQLVSKINKGSVAYRHIQRHTNMAAYKANQLVQTHGYTIRNKP